MFGLRKRRDHRQGIEIIHHTKQADIWRDGRWLVVSGRLSMDNAKDREQAIRVANEILREVAAREPQEEPSPAAASQIAEPPVLGANGEGDPDREASPRSDFDSRA